MQAQPGRTPHQRTRTVTLGSEGDGCAHPNEAERATHCASTRTLSGTLRESRLRRPPDHRGQSGKVLGTKRPEPGRGHPGPRPRPRPRFVRGRGRSPVPVPDLSGIGDSPPGPSPGPSPSGTRSPRFAEIGDQAVVLEFPKGVEALAQVWSHNSQITRRTASGQADWQLKPHCRPSEVANGPFRGCDEPYAAQPAFSRGSRR
jgi:hypothetical protein